MTTATLHAQVQRSRFAQHAFASLAQLFSFGERTVGTGQNSADSAALEAQKVRALAHRYAKTDPGFSADLYAAAARHEGLHAD